MEKNEAGIRRQGMCGARGKNIFVILYEVVWEGLIRNPERAMRMGHESIKNSVAGRGKAPHLKHAWHV